MGFRIGKIKPRLLRKKKSYDAEEVLRRLNSFLNDSMTAPMKILHGFWQDQINAMSYQEIRHAILSGSVSAQTLRDWRQDYSKLVTEKFSDVWKEALAQGYKGQPYMDNLSNFRLDMQRPGVLNWINSRGADFVTYSTNEQREAIKLLVGKNVVDKHSVDELARAIRPTIGLYRGQAVANLRYYDNVKATLERDHPRMSAASVQRKAREAALKYAEKQHRERAMMIARTERAFAFNRGAYEGIKQAQAMGLMGPMEKVWSTSRGGNVCPDCEALEGETVGMDDPFFESRGLFVGDNLTPPLHPRCYCAIMFKEVDGKEMEQYRRDDEDQILDEEPAYQEPIGVKDDGTWAYGNDALREQYYREYSTDRNDNINHIGYANASRVVSISDKKLYISDNANNSKRTVQTINTLIDKTIRKMGLNGMDNLPVFIITSQNEFPEKTLGSYNPGYNRLRISDAISSKAIRDEIQKPYSAPKNKLSTLIHELVHWKDAQEYIKLNGKMDKNYFVWANENAKQKLANLKKQGYNVHKISEYARKSLLRGAYDEAYTEFRVLTFLGW